MSYASLRAFAAMKKLKDGDAMLVAFPPQRGQRREGDDNALKYLSASGAPVRLRQRKRAVLARWVQQPPKANDFGMVGE